jgi:hypothetical protein
LGQEVIEADPRDVAEANQSRGAQEIFTPRLGHRDVNHGAVAIESERAVAEVQAQIFLAKKFPRSFHQARADFLEACASMEFAAEAFYTVPNRGHGPSIRFAEELARCYGNFDYGHIELSRSEGKSEVEVFAWDKEKNNRSKRQVTVLHVRDTKSGPRPLTDQTDIDNRVANVASKQMRGRILALVPKALVAEGKAACKRTLAGDTTKTIAQRVGLMVTAFGKFGVTVQQLETYLKHKLDLVTDDELADMMGIHIAIRDGVKASEYFGADATNDGEQTNRGAALGRVIASEGDKVKPAAAKDTTKDQVAGAAKDAKTGDKPTAVKITAGKTAAATGEKPAAKAATTVKPATAPVVQQQPEPEPEVEDGDEAGDDGAAAAEEDDDAF